MKITEPKEEWLIIVNPNAGRGLGKKDWRIISELLKEYKISYKAQFTEYKKHAIELAKEGIANGYRKIIAVGGDGTMNEIVNGCFLQTVCPSTDITLSIVTVGTGNDWGKMFGIPTDYNGAVKVISVGNAFLQDTGVVYYYHGAHREQRYFINIAGLGFDAVVVRRTNIQKEKGRKGKLLYFWNLLTTLIFYRHTQTEVMIDGNKISEKVFTISLGIGKYSGGGMMQTPDAIPDDGLFDITIIKKISRRNVIKSLKMLYNGTILEHPLTMGYKGRDIIIDADPLIHVEADGETLGHSPIEFSILPRSIHVIYNKDNGFGC
ncbi:MAG: diacylglycerol kinase family lipid kinase [Bacteroidales bacterium]|nr:diacylglycerol kinase family lipid kinase [Bacteroidales bacterium]